MDTPNFAPDGLAGGTSALRPDPASYQTITANVARLIESKKGTWDGINAESVARMRLQNRFLTGLDIALYTQSLGAWHGFVAQQQMIAVKKHFGTTKRRYIYLSGWMVAALRSEFGPLPDQSMHEKTTVPALIKEIYTFLKQADARELGNLYREIDAAREAGDSAKETELLNRVENYESHVVPIIADIDAGFGNAEATYLLAKKMIEAGRQSNGPARGLRRQNPRHPLRLPGVRRGGRHHRHPHRLPRRRPDQADRRQPHAWRPWRSVQCLPRL